MKKDYDFETRSEGKIRIEAQLKEREQERETVEQKLGALEAEHLEPEARQFERNKAFKDALETWREIRRLKPDDPQTADEISRLEARHQHFQQLTEYINRLYGSAEIQPIYPKVRAELQRMRATGDQDEALMDIVDDFLKGHRSADDFIKTWQELTTASTNEEPNYRALAGRLKRGEIVLFLGSGISRLLNGPAPIETLVSELKEDAKYKDCPDSLSMIAEYYQAEYGRPALLDHLKTLVGTPAPDISLYRLLARIEQPLVLISGNYDLFLEHQLQQAGRKYALIASIIISNPSDCELGNVIVHYSDREAPELPCLEEKLSSLKLIEDGYALIYKIRGYCNTVHEQMAHQQNMAL